MNFNAEIIFSLCFNPGVTASIQMTDDDDDEIIFPEWNLFTETTAVLTNAIKCLSCVWVAYNGMKFILHDDTDLTILIELC